MDEEKFRVEVRGKAHRNAFATMCVALVLCTVCSEFWVEFRPLHTLMICAFLSVGAFRSTNSYYIFDDSGRARAANAAFMVVGSLVAVSSLGLLIFSHNKPEEISKNFVYLSIGLYLLSDSAAYYINQNNNKKNKNPEE